MLINEITFQTFLKMGLFLKWCNRKFRRAIHEIGQAHKYFFLLNRSTHKIWQGKMLRSSAMYKDNE